ncbi:MAG: cation transporter [Alphaproteobacteria bacterium]|nr:MAG: cation transporter [Alphaproteobacteria bacterium]
MHGHHHHHLSAQAGDRRLLLAIVVNLALTVAQLVAGIVSGSLAMIADAVHNFSDAGALMLAWGARRIARRPADPSMSFGYGRAEILAAFANYIALILIALWLVWEGVMRLLQPQPVEGWIVVIVAGIALVVDTATAVLTFRLARESVNVRAAFLHNLADALGSVAVMVAGALILLFGWWVVDPIVTFGIAGYILWQALRELGPVVRVLMLGAPEGLDPGEVRAAMQAVEGVADVHHLHLWQIDEKRSSLEAHVVEAPGAAPGLRRRLLDMLGARFGIGHATLQIETPEEACEEHQPR